MEEEWATKGFKVDSEDKVTKDTREAIMDLEGIKASREDRAVREDKSIREAMVGQEDLLVKVVSGVDSSSPISSLLLRPTRTITNQTAHSLLPITAAVKVEVVARILTHKAAIKGVTLMWGHLLTQ